MPVPPAGPYAAMPPQPAAPRSGGSSKVLWWVGGGATLVVLLGLLVVAAIVIVAFVAFWTLGSSSAAPAPVATPAPPPVVTAPPPAPMPVAPPAHAPEPECGDCSWDGTKCQNGACVLDPQASWTLRATTLYADPSATLGSSVRVCTRRSGEQQFWCSPLRTPAHPATTFPKEQNVALGVTTPDLVSSRGIDIQIQQNGRVWCTQYNTSHTTGLRPGNLLFEGGVAYKLPACGKAFTRVVFALEHDAGGGD